MFSVSDGVCGAAMRHQVCVNWTELAGDATQKTHKRVIFLGHSPLVACGSSSGGPGTVETQCICSFSVCL